MPATTTIERSVVVAAPAAAILPHLADLHRWTEWSPWEGQDPDLHREYGGEPGTVGSTYAWKRNRKAWTGTGTRVVWTMTSPRTTMSRIVGTFVDMDKLIGGDFDKGLAQLKAVAER